MGLLAPTLFARPIDRTVDDVAPALLALGGAPSFAVNGAETLISYSQLVVRVGFEYAVESVCDVRAGDRKVALPRIRRDLTEGCEQRSHGATFFE
jgi:hypothetical protein